MKTKYIVRDIHGVEYKIGDLIRPYNCPLESLIWDGKAKCIREVIGIIYMDTHNSRPYINAHTQQKGLAEYIIDGPYYKIGDVVEFSIDSWDGVFNNWTSYEIISR